MTHEQVHFTRNGVLWHCWYTREANAKRGASWQKVADSERACDCEDRGEDRRALVGINVKINHEGGEG